MMNIRSRLDRLERFSPAKQCRSIIQMIDFDGTAKPTDEEVEAWKVNTEAEGFEPVLVQITIHGRSA